jgi:long-subunit acyl-CoA synthetase (AMP-forming)
MNTSTDCGATVHFADENALKGSLKQTLLRVRPTLFFGVPRVWQKMQDAMLKAAAEKYSKPIVGPILKTIGSGAKSIASAW